MRPHAAHPIRAPAEPRRRTVAADVLAGLSVAMVLVPQSLAYAELAGMPPVNGLYASILPPLAAALLASSPYLQTGPVAVTSLLTFGTLSVHAEPASAEYVQLGLLLAVLVGAVRLMLGLLHAGGIAYLMSQPMLAGFVPAAALLIVASQLPAALGSAPPAGDVLEQAAWTASHPGSWGLSALALALVGLVLVLGGRRVHPLFPGVVLAAAVGLVASEALGYGGARVGAIPQQLPPVSLDLPWMEMPTLAVGAVIIGLVGFSEAAAVARRFAAEDRVSWRPNRELLGQGAANVAAGLSGGMPCGASFSRSSINRLAGARTRLSGAVTGAAVLCFLPFAGLLSSVPTAVLAAVVIASVIGLLRPAEITELARWSRPQLFVAIATFGLTLALAPHIERGVIAGIGLSIVVHLWRSLAFDVETRREGDTLHVIPHGVLWFATAQKLQDALLTALDSEPGLVCMRVHLGGLGRIDVTGALALRWLAERAEQAGMTLEVTDIPPHARRLTEGPMASRTRPPAT